MKPRYISFISLCISLFSALSASAQQRPERKPVELPPNYQAFTHKTMTYRLLIPKDYDPTRKYPLTLCLHGAGGRGVDNLGRGTEAASILISDPIQEQHPSFVLTPQCPQAKQWVNTPWGNGSYSVENTPISDEMTLALEILDGVMKEYSIDPARVYVSGQSMGGYGSWDALLRRPKLFAAAIINCGAGDPTRAESIKDIPIWNFHGDMDKVVPVSGSREIVQAIERVGGNVRYTEMAGVGHESWRKAWKTPGLIDWLFEQRTRLINQTDNLDRAVRMEE